MTRYSGTDSRNPDVVDWTKDHGARDNIAFFSAALEALAAKATGNGGLMTIGLLGQRDLPGFTLRTAQSILRWDLRPSLWSHVFLLAARVEPTAEAVAAAPIREVSLYSRSGQFPDPAYNAVTSGTLGQYAGRAIDANAALLAIGMSDDEAAAVAERAENPNLDRPRFDFWEMLGVWESYLWSSGARSNPLRDGMPIHASAFAEYCFEAIRLDLSPGASERNSAPEHVWNAAVWWHDAFAEFGHPFTGYYVLRDKQCSLLDPDELRTELAEAVPA